MGHNQDWVVVQETDNLSAKTKRIEYTADASAFDVDLLLSETEDELFQLMRSNIAYDHLPGDFHSRVQYKVEHDADDLIAGIVRRLAERDYEMQTNLEGGWWNLSSAPSTATDAVPKGHLVADKFGIKVFRLHTPIEFDAK